MGTLCGSTLPEPSYNNMDYQEEHKFIEAQQIPTDPIGVVLCEQLEIFLSCKHLPKLDIKSPSDPFIIIYQRMDTDNEYHEIAKTEMVKDNNNPEFTKTIIIDYHFENVQFIRLDIYDADTSNLNHLSKHDFVGRCEFILADLVHENGNILKMNIIDKRGKIRKYKNNKSECIIRSEEIKTNHDQFMIQFECRDLDKPSWTSRTNPYLQLYRAANNNGGWMSIMRTKRFIKQQNAKWNVVKIPIQRLCNGDYNRSILIKCFHDKHDNEPIEIGQCTTSLQALLDETSKNLINPMKGNKVTGTLLFHKKEIIKRYGLLEYVMGGMNIEMMAGIDFTGSNGDPRSEGTLHFCGPPKYESPYMRAIRSVGRVVECYDTDKQINAYGFGANINPFGNKHVSHCFNLTLTNTATVDGIEGVLSAYIQSLNKIQLYGPTDFAPIINTCASMADSKINNEREQNYVILMMITDGIISDMKQTIDAIVNASHLPLSIIIVGVGDADFGNMQYLDADDHILTSRTGVKMKRDIVQFVPFNKYKRDIGLLAKAVLEEIPAQITGYMTMNKLYPLRKVDNMQDNDSSLNVYLGPSDIVRAGTQFIQNMGHQAINPYYGQQTEETEEMKLQPNQTGFNPAAIVVHPSAPSAPLD